MKKEIILIKNGKFKQSNPEDLATLLSLWQNDNDLINITNQETIDLLNSKPNIQELIFNITNDFFNESIRYYSNKIESSGGNRDDLDSELSLFFSEYNDLRTLYPNEFRDALLNNFKLNNDETTLFIESCTNSQNQSLNFLFFNELKNVNKLTTSRAEFEEEFMNWLSDWETKKSLDRGHNSKFNRKYEVFFRYLEEVLLRSENTEILADLKNYVMSGHFYNDLLSPNPKNETPELWNLRKSFLEFISGKSSQNNEEIFKNAMLERQRSTLTYVNAKTNVSNDLASTTVDIHDRETFRNINDLNRRFADGATIIMPPGYLDRSRHDVDNLKTIHVDDVKSSEQLKDNDAESIKKNLLAGVLLAKDYNVYWSITTPSHCPNLDDSEKSKVQIPEDVTDEEINSIQELYLINAVADIKRFVDLSNHPASKNLKVCKSNIGSQSNEYVSISDYEIPAKLHNILSFLEKNNSSNNEGRWASIFSFFIQTNINVRTTYSPDERENFEKLFTSEYNERILKLLNDSPWYVTSNNTLLDILFTMDNDAQLAHNAKKLKDSRDRTITIQEKLMIDKVKQEFDCIIKNQTSLSEVEMNELKNLSLEYSNLLWSNTYGIKTNKKLEIILIDHQNKIQNSSLDATVKNRLNNSSEIFGDLDKLNYYIYSNQLNKVEDLVLKICDDVKSNGIPSGYRKSQSLYMQQDKSKNFNIFMDKLLNFAEIINNRKLNGLENESQLRLEYIGKLKNLNVSDENKPEIDNLIATIKQDSIGRPKP